MIALRYRLWTALGIVLVCVPGTWAQQQNQDESQSQDQSQPQDQSQTPIPAYHSPFASAADNSNTDNANTGPQSLAPDTQPLAGAQSLSLGVPESRSYWQPAASVSSTAASNGLGASNGWTTYTTLLGGLNLHDIAGRSDLALSYLGGGLISNDGAIGNGVIQELGLDEKLSWRRATLSFIDEGSYLPEAGFGYGGVGGLALPGGSPVLLQPGLLPSATILTTRNQQFDNSFLTEIDTRLSPRSSLTFMGGYSLLRFLGTNLLNMNDTIFQAGYNHDLTRKDTIAVLYRFNAFRFGNSGQSINDNIAQLSYARRVTGRVAFQIAAGPEFTFFGTPVLTGSVSTNSTATSSLTTWSLSTSLTYQWRQSQLGLSYAHGVSGGAGVFAGAIGDTVTGSLSHQMTRTFDATITTGYAKNNALAIPGFAIINQSYSYWFAGASLSHPWGRTMNLFLSYQAQYQNSNFEFCAGPTCGTSLIIHLISVGLNWQGRPIAF
ncbi:MAG TPA: hypothetical protein VNE63_16175 [Candidatus Acidoferrales bacterium]|nr:hypothetical protein [Candidatus Acidoferrales bacterium]